MSVLALPYELRIRGVACLLGNKSHFYAWLQGLLSLISESIGANEFLNMTKPFRALQEIRSYLQGKSYACENFTHMKAQIDH